MSKNKQFIEFNSVLPRFFHAVSNNGNLAPLAWGTAGNSPEIARPGLIDYVNVNLSSYAHFEIVVMYVDPKYPRNWVL